jgi:methionyl-tRNA synthetase
LERWEIGAALGSIWEFVRRTNQYIEQSEPWRLARQPDQAQHLDTVLATAAEATRLLALYLQPYIPASSERMLAQLGLAPAVAGEWSVAGTWGRVGLEHVAAGPLLFPRIDVDKETKEGKDAAHRG